MYLIVGIVQSGLFPKVFGEVLVAVHDEAIAGSVVVHALLDRVEVSVGFFSADVDAANVVQHVPLQLAEGLGRPLLVGEHLLHGLPLGQVVLVAAVEEGARYARLKRQDELMNELFEGRSKSRTAEGFDLMIPASYPHLLFY